VAVRAPVYADPNKFGELGTRTTVKFLGRAIIQPPIPPEKGTKETTPQIDLSFSFTPPFSGVAIGVYSVMDFHTDGKVAGAYVIGSIRLYDVAAKKEVCFISRTGARTSSSSPAIDREGTTISLAHPVEAGREYELRGCWHSSDPASEAFVHNERILYAFLIRT